MLVKMTMFVLVTGSSVLADEAPPALSKYLACYEAVHGGLSLGSHVAVVPSDRNGKRGLYIYTDKSAYFYPLGTPSDSNKFYNYYYFQLGLPKHSDIYLVFSDDKNGGKNSSLAYEAEPKPAPSLAGKYRPIADNDALDDAARGVLSAQLKKAVGEVTSEFQNDLELARSGDLPYPKMEDYKNKLNTCALAGDPSLQNAVLAEKEKLTGDPASGAGAGGDLQEHRDGYNSAK